MTEVLSIDFFFFTASIDKFQPGVITGIIVDVYSRFFQPWNGPSGETRRVDAIISLELEDYVRLDQESIILEIDHLLDIGRADDLECDLGLVLVDVVPHGSLPRETVAGPASSLQSHLTVHLLISFRKRGN